MNILVKLGKYLTKPTPPRTDDLSLRQMKKNLNRAHSVLVEHFTSDSRTRSGTVRPLKNVNSIVPHKILCRQIHTETFVKNPIKPLSKSVLQPAKTKAGLVNSRSFSTVDQSATENLFALPNAKDIPLFTQELAVSDLPANLEDTPLMKESIYSSLPIDIVLELSAADERLLEQYANSEITSFTPRQLFQFGYKADQRNVISSAKFLHSELVIRFAQLAVFCRSIPTRSDSTVLLREMAQHYCTTFLLLLRSPAPVTMKDAEQFTALSHFILRRSNRFDSVFATYIICRAMLGRKKARHGVSHMYQPNFGAGVDFSQASSAFHTSSPFPKPSSGFDPTATSGVTPAGSSIPDTFPAVADLLQVMDDPSEMFVVQEALDNFHISRVETRLLLAQHAALHQALLHPRPDFAGLIEIHCKPSQVIRDSFKRAQVRALARLEPTVSGKESYEELKHDIEQKMFIPELHIDGEVDWSLRFLQPHLAFIITEILTNSLLALVQRYPKVRGATPPAIEVVIAKSSNDFIIRISDQGGGLPRALLEPIWTYTYSMNKWMMHPLTRKVMALEEAQNQREYEKAESQEKQFNSSPSSSSSSIQSSVEIPGIGVNINHDHSFIFEQILNAPEISGVGLPKARLIARYLGGDVSVMSLHGYGLDAYITLSKEGIVTPHDVDMEVAPVNFLPAEHTL